jgi:hypothetical protein
VPYIGATVTGAVATLVALAANGPGDALLTLAAVIAVQQLEGNFLEPVIVGRQVRLHPVAVVVVVFAGSLAASIAGAVIAVPLTAVSYRIYRVLRDRQRCRSTGADRNPAPGPSSLTGRPRRPYVEGNRRTPEVDMDSILERDIAVPDRPPVGRRLVRVRATRGGASDQGRRARLHAVADASPVRHRRLNPKVDSVVSEADDDDAGAPAR